VSAAAVGAVSAPETAAAIDALVRVENLSVAFDGTTVVSGIGFTLEPGRCVALVGESGSGKSVTARSLLGLAGRGSTVTADRLTVGAHDLLRLDEREWRGLRGREVGLVLQDALVSLDPLVNIRGQLNEPLRLHTELNRPERLSRSAELLSEVGIADAALRLRQYPHQLSGGLRQRALIASAVAANPRVLIADEPTTALDVTVQKQVLALLARLKAQGTGLLLVSHDLAVVSSLADEILVLRGGELVERGDPDAVLRDPQASYTKELIAAIPSGSSRGTRLS
jgi:peptide/nickel transport system ATP-binding protein